MITCINTRHNGAPTPSVTTCLWAAHEAFRSFISGEIAFGTTIIELTPTRIVCRTDPSGSKVVDVVTFEGREGDMLPLFRAAVAYITIMGDAGEKVYDHALDQLPMLPDGGYWPFLVAQLLPLIAGGSLAGLVCLLATGNTPTRELLDLGPKALLIAATYSLETGWPLVEVLA
jgi:hypothetical protein